MKTLNKTAIRNKVQEICENYKVDFYSIDFDNNDASSFFQIMTKFQFFDIKFLLALEQEFNTQQIGFFPFERDLFLDIYCSNDKYRL